MKKIFPIIFFCFISRSLSAQPNTDSIAYTQQSKRINDMLAQRTAKFGEYDQSLNQHTGIFGFQTKKDIRHSNDILMDIVKTDDQIYHELKILLDYRIFQQQQVQDHSRETDQATLGYMSTINKLRNQVEKLKTDAERQQQQQSRIKNILIVILIAFLLIILALLSRRNKVKA